MHLHAPHRAEPWHDLAHVTSIAAILDLDHTCVPLSTSSDDGPDHSLLLLLDALHFRTNIETGLALYLDRDGDRRLDDNERAHPIASGGR